MCTEGLGADQKPGGGACNEDGVTGKTCQSLCLVHQLKDTGLWKGNF